MRFWLGVLLGAFIVTPALAQTDGPRNFAREVCPQTIPCPGSGGSPMSTSAMMSLANSCVGQFFGYTGPDGLFDSVAGLDTDNCFVAIPNIIPKGAGSQLAPACCVIPKVGAPSGTCVIRCELNTTQ